MPAGVSDNSLASAAVVVPLVLEHVRAGSVIDFGCKHGEWLSLFQRHGVREVLGLDWHDRMDLLLIEPARFRRVDLRQQVNLAERFDLAVCLEVAEHLPAAAAEPLVSMLTTVAPVVLFSAAVPLQGGNQHLNERPRQYWERMFARRDFIRIDCIRPRVWQDARVAWWYRQNICFYASTAALARHPRLSDRASRSVADDLELVHVDVLYRQSTLKGWLRRLAVRCRSVVARLVARE